MAISLIAKPQDITPAYNPMKFIYDSTNKNELGFRYIFDVYLSGTATKIAEYRPLPNPDGYGEWDGLIDEVAVWNRSLSADEILDIYKRGALKLNISARSCNDAICDTETFTDLIVWQKVS